ncbi:DUF2442 domain-containing protein [Candidatus Oscillochloris fontis]|uniref:DUF2442 domain-containing protein n=1 Tax=Candidatus Oscillochloris fontis TaxID=2496868 RepID=UPI00101BDE00|nr:DUF2442 domain-containing protein [Candidatus Oscillochloris fontis]
MPHLIRVQSAEPLETPRIRVVFTNGEQREIDLTPYIATGPIFEPVRTDPTFFPTVTVDGGTLTWPNGADIDPDVLYHGGTPPWAQAAPHPEEARS